VILTKLGDNETLPKGKIIYHENTYNGIDTDSLLLFRVQNQINGVMVVNCLPKKQHHMKGLSPSLRLSNLGFAEAQSKKDGN